MWQEFPASAAKGGIPMDRLPQYVHLMLDRSASVHRGSEPMRVSARLTPKDIESVDRTAGRNPNPATAIDAEVWIDEEGRIVRVRQEIRFASDPTFRTRSRPPFSRAPCRSAHPSRGEHHPVRVAGRAGSGRSSAWRLIAGSG
ncbi:hypothetical protein [Streptomyces sp. TE33382]